MWLKECLIPVSNCFKQFTKHYHWLGKVCATVKYQMKYTHIFMETGFYGNTMKCTQELSETTTKLSSRITIQRTALQIVPYELLWPQEDKVTDTLFRKSLSYLQAHPSILGSNILYSSIVMQLLTMQVLSDNMIWQGSNQRFLEGHDKSFWLSSLPSSYHLLLVRPGIATLLC